MIYAWLAKNAVRIAIAIAALLAVWWLYQFVTAAPKAEAELAGNQVEAVQRSAEDAIDTVGAAGDRESASADLTRSNDRDIRNAEGADARVADPARDAGLRGLCLRRAYRGDPKCLQFAHP